MDFTVRSVSDDLVARFAGLFRNDRIPGPILDIACGDGHNGIFLAKQGSEVVLADRSSDALEAAARNAAAAGVAFRLWQVDLELPGTNPLPENAYGGVLVFRYLHRPLIPCIQKCIRPGGILCYETFTRDQQRYGKPRNPDHLLAPGELLGWFHGWEILYSFEGIMNNPERAVARLVCKKPL